MGKQMSERRLFGRPIRPETTGEFFPYKLTLESFCERMKNNVDGFEKNMKNLGGVASRAKYIERWTEQLLAWSEIEQK